MKAGITVPLAFPGTFILVTGIVVGRKLFAMRQSFFPSPLAGEGAERTQVSEAGEGSELN
jgi:hypothetical protein